MLNGYKCGPRDSLRTAQKVSVRMCCVYVWLRVLCVCVCPSAVFLFLEHGSSRMGAAGGPSGADRPSEAHGDAVGSWVRTSIVHRYGTVDRPVEPCWVPSCQNGVRMETPRNPTWPDGTQGVSTDRSTVPYRCTIDIRTHTGPYGAPAIPDGTQCS